LDLNRDVGLKVESWFAANQINFTKAALYCTNEMAPHGCLKKFDAPVSLNQAIFFKKP
jgi:hypothetical protein